MNNFQEPIDEIRQNLIKNIPLIMQEYCIQGFSLVMIKDSKIAFDLEFGVKNSETKEPIDVRTVFEGASWSKPILGYAALIMCQQGLLELDKPLENYVSIPYREGNDPERLSKVTLRQILFHSSGLPDEHLLPDAPVYFFFEPGEGYLYSSEGYNYLTYAMQFIAQGELADYIQKHVFDPLGMVDTSFIWEQRYETQAASPHNRRGEVVEKWRPRRVVGSCSLHTTPTDFAKFLIEVNEQAKKPPEQNILNMLDPQIPCECNLMSCFGWQIELTPEGEVFIHPGNTVTFKSLAMFYRQQEFGVVYMTNSATSYPAFPQILDLTVGGDHQDITVYAQFLEDDGKYAIYQEEALLFWWRYYGFDSP